MFDQIHAIARNTFTESIRQPIFLVLTLVGILAMLLTPAMAKATFEDDAKLVLDMGLSTIAVTGLLLAAFTATGVISQEVENKTVLTVVSKPVSRPVFIIGKYIGILAALIVAFWILSVALMLALRHGVMDDASKVMDGPVWVFGVAGVGVTATIVALGNYFYRWVFTSTMLLGLAVQACISWLLVLVTSSKWTFQPLGTDVNPQLLLGLALLLQGLAIITAVAVVASTRLGQVMTLMITLATFLIGLINEYVNTRLQSTGSAWREWYYNFYRVVPNMQVFWPTDALTQGITLTGGYVGAASGVCALFVAAMLCLAVALFQTREVG